MSVRPFDNIIDINNDIGNQHQKKLKLNQFLSNNNSLLQSLTNNQHLITIAQHNVVFFHNHTKQLQIIYEAYLNNINILGLTEINLPS